MKGKIKRKCYKAVLTSIACFLCVCILGSSSFNNISKSNALAQQPDLNFNWDNGLSAKLDSYGTRYNGNLGIKNGGDSIIKNADGGLPNAPVAGNGNLGAVLGGDSSGQSVVVGLNDFWNGVYDETTFTGNTSPLSFGSVGYNIVDDNNLSNTDVDLATTYKNIKTSSEVEGHPATAAVGGDYVSNAFWGMGWWTGKREGKNSWLELEFDAPITFSRVAVWSEGSSRYDADLNVEDNGKVNAWENSTINTFEVQTSDDGITWTTAFREEDNLLPIYDRDLATSATGKFVRLFIENPLVDHEQGAAKVAKFSLYGEKKNDKNLMPIVANGQNAAITVTSNTVPDREHQDAAHIYTTSTVYATACGTQQHLSGYGSMGYGWFTDSDPTNDAITYKLNKATTFKSYQLWNGSASAAGSNNRGDWRGWTVETSTNGTTWKEVHKVNLPKDSSEPTWAGQPAINSYDIPSDKVADATDVSYIRLKCLGAFGGRALLSQFKIFGDTLAASGIDQTNSTTFIQNIKEGKIGVESSYKGQSYEAMTSVSQDGSNYVVTKFTNNSDKALNMRYYASTRLYNLPTTTQGAGVTEDGKTLYATRTTETAAPSNLAWVASGTIAATLDGETTWLNSGHTRDSAYGEFSIPAKGTICVKSYVDNRQYTNTTKDFNLITAANAPTKEIAIDKSREKTGETIISESSAWWRSYWEKAYIDVYNRSVDEYFYTASYIVGCSSRVGSVPSSLFGPFVTADTTAWGGTYVADYNLYGTYMAVAGMNREELLLPLVVNALESWGGIKGVGTGIGSKYGDIFNTATNNNFTNSDGSLMFQNGVDGILSAVVSAPHGYAVNMPGFYHILFSSAYAALPVISFYDMTQGTGKIYDDLTLTDEVLYDYLKDMIMLWEQILVYEDGVYKVKYDAAWENEPNNMGNAFTIASVHMFSQRLVGLADKLGITQDDEPRLAKWKHIDKNLEPYPTANVDDNGTVRECFSDTLTTAQKGSVTYNGRTDGNSNPNVVVAQVIPTDQLSLYSDPAQKQIMRNSLATIKSWGNINAMPTIFSTAARVGYGSTIYGNDSSEGFESSLSEQTLMAQMGKVVDGGVKMNNISKLVDPLQLIDTCGGVQGINDMLVQESKGIITLFPAYSKTQAGKFVNLQVNGGYLVTAAQDNTGAVTFAKINSQFGGRVTLALPEGANWDIVDSDGNVVTVTSSTVGDLVGFEDYKAIKTISFDTLAGKSYYKVDKGVQGAAFVAVDHNVTDRREK